MKFVHHLLETKGRKLISVDPDASVFDAIKLMADEGIGSLVVMQGGALKGIVTERDYARKVILKGRASDSTKISEIMTENVRTTSPEEPVDRCMEMMTELKCRHLPVIENDQVVAMISIGDLVQAIITDQKEEIEHLEHYIAG